MIEVRVARYSFERDVGLPRNFDREDSEHMRISVPKISFLWCIGSFSIPIRQDKASKSKRMERGPSTAAEGLRRTSLVMLEDIKPNVDGR